MSKQMILSVMSKDRPGIIADVTGTIFDLDGDLADLNQSLLGGYLTMILVASFPEQVTPDDVLHRLSDIPSEVKIEATVKLLDIPVELAKTSLPEKTYVVTAQGENKSGLVYGISSFCCERDINIIDLSTTLNEGRYTMILQIDLSNVAHIRQFREDLDRYATNAGLRVVMQHYDIFKATNEVALI